MYNIQKIDKGVREVTLSDTEYVAKLEGYSIQELVDSVYPHFGEIIRRGYAYACRDMLFGTAEKAPLSIAGVPSVDKDTIDICCAIRTIAQNGKCYMYGSSVMSIISEGRVQPCADVDIMTGVSHKTFIAVLESLGKVEIIYQCGRRMKLNYNGMALDITRVDDLSEHAVYSLGDFTVTACCYAGTSDTFLFHPDSLLHYRAKELHLYHYYPALINARVAKYITKGYMLVRE